MKCIAAVVMMAFVASASAGNIALTAPLAYSAPLAYNAPLTYAAPAPLTYAAPLAYAAPAPLAYTTTKVVAAPIAPIAYTALPGEAKYTALNRGALHEAPLPGHSLSQTSLNLAPAANLINLIIVFMTTLIWISTIDPTFAFAMVIIEIVVLYLILCVNSYYLEITENSSTSFINNADYEERIKSGFNYSKQTKLNFKKSNMKCIAAVVMMAFIACASAGNIAPLAYSSGLALPAVSQYSSIPASTLIASQSLPILTYNRPLAYINKPAILPLAAPLTYNRPLVYSNLIATPKIIAAPKIIAPAPITTYTAIPGQAKYTAWNRGALHQAPLPGHGLSQTSLNLAPAGSW
ncbi:uncharacterized protein LOC134828504 [Culicoides brevitarsis]|uniref:uncharacterized protein LOC134828504 n=1 Tax=Culicoides brevitarsis TaxID=469753 RepID=UPI00307B151D